MDFESHLLLKNVVWASATHTAPPTILPNVTGSKLPSSSPPTVTGAPNAMPCEVDGYACKHAFQKRTMGIKNMLATLCSSPIDTNADTGSRHATNLPQNDDVATACHSAMHTNQLQSMPRTNACVDKNCDNIHIRLS